MTARRLFGTLPAALLILAPLVLLLLFIKWFAVNVPSGDEWHLAEDLYAVQQGHERLADLWRLHNEHRMLFPRAALIGLALRSGWNAVVEMYASVVLLVAALSCWWRLRREIGAHELWIFVPVAWLLLSPGQWENILTGWQLQFCLGTAAMVWAMYLVGRDSVAAFGGAIGCAIVASYSFNNGLIVWPAGVVALALRRASTGRLIRWIAAGIAVSIIYYVGYAGAAHHPSPAESVAHPFETLGFFVMNVGAPLAGGSLLMASTMGVLFLALLMTSAMRVWSRRHELPPVSTANASLCALLALSLASSLAIAVGRVGFHKPEWAISSRYLTITSLGISAFYLLFFTRGERDRWIDLRSMLLGLVLVGETFSIGWALQASTELRLSRMKQKYAVQTFLRQPDDAFANDVDAALVRKYGVFLQGMGWSVFRDPVSFVMLASTDNGLPVGEILPDRPVVQQMTCPVSTLTDLQILFATYKRKVTAPVRIRLADADKPVVDRVLPGSTFQDNVWIEVPVSPPVEQCAGKDLTLTISSPDAKPGNAVTVWTYPRYYKAVLVSPKDKPYADRVLGIAVNIAEASIK